MQALDDVEAGQLISHVSAVLSLNGMVHLNHENGACSPPSPIVRTC